MAQYDFITAEEFNALKDRINAECQRRSAEADQYNKDPIINPNITDVVKLTDEIKAQKINEMLAILYKFNVFPGLNLMDVSYQDGQVLIGDYIFPINGLSTIVTKLEQESRINNDDCKAGCMGLCTDSCADVCTGTCSDTCTGCTGSCTGGCAGGCNDTCAEGCMGQCGASCSRACGWTCSSECAIGCGNSCTHDCSVYCAYVR